MAGYYKDDITVSLLVGTGAVNIFFLVLRLIVVALDASPDQDVKISLKEVWNYFWGVFGIYYSFCRTSH